MKPNTIKGDYERRSNWDAVFMLMALSAAQLSHCTRYKVGCIIVKGRRPLVIGINGTPPGQKNCDDVFFDVPVVGMPEYEDYRGKHGEWSRGHEDHAESNAIGWAAQKGIILEGADLYSTLSPCPPCARVVRAAGLRSWTYLEEYDRDDGALEYLYNANIRTEKMFIGSVGAMLNMNQDLLEEIQCRERANAPDDSEFI